MIPFQTILCAVDQSEYSRSTLQRASDLGRVLHGTVAVMTVETGREDKWQLLPDSALDFDEAYGLRSAGTEDRAVAKLIGFVRESAGVTSARAIVVRGHVVPAILRVAHEVAADLIVVGMHGPPGGFAGLILSPATERVAGKATCPVLAVPRRPPTKTGDFVFRTIVCGVDRSASSWRALEYALLIGQQVGACVIVVHAIEDIADEDPKITAGHFNTPECRREIAPEVHAAYQRLLPGDLRLERGVQLQTPVGTAHAHLLQVTKETSAELIVIGATGWRGSFGKTAQHVLREAGCDVMVVPARAKMTAPTAAQ